MIDVEEQKIILLVSALCSNVMEDIFVVLVDLFYED